MRCSQIPADQLCQRSVDRLNAGFFDRQFSKFRQIDARDSLSLVALSLLSFCRLTAIAVAAAVCLPVHPSIRTCTLACNFVSPALAQLRSAIRLRLIVPKPTRLPTPCSSLFPCIRTLPPVPCSAPVTRHCPTVSTPASVAFLPPPSPPWPVMLPAQPRTSV